MALQIGPEMGIQQQNKQQQQLNQSYNPNLDQLRLPPGSAKMWGAAIAAGAATIAKEAEREAREAETKRRAELEKQQRQEEWERTNGRQTPEQVDQKRGARGEMKAQTEKEKLSSVAKTAEAGNKPGASPLERHYAKVYGNQSDKDRDPRDS